MYSCRSKLRCAALPMIVCLFLAGAARAQDQPPAAAPEPASTKRGPTDPRELEAFIDGVMATQFRKEHIAGATFAVIVDNKPFFSKGYGYADVAARRKVDPEKTMFRIGSVSKLFTWTAVMRLAEQGKLDLDADVNMYLKDFQIPATYPEPVTLKHLLSHTPGFEDHVIGLFGRAPSETPLGALLARSFPARVRKPGELASYSNHGTALAGYIVEQVSGMPWEDYIEQTILQPLGMNHTTVRQPPTDKLPADLSKGYRWASGRFEEVPFEYVPPAPAGSMSSSALDLAKFMIAHLQNGTFESAEILKENTARQMRSLLFTHDPRLEGMAYGFMRMRYDGEEIVEHGGDTDAFHTYFVMLPERNAGMIASYNTTTAGQARSALLELFLDRYYPPLEEPKVKGADDFAKRAPRYHGQYGALRHSYTSLAKLGALFSIVDVLPADDGIVISTSAGARRYAEVEPNVFREVDGQRVLAFRTDDHDRATHLFFSGSPVAFARLPWYETPQFALAIIVACVAVCLSVVIGWPLASFINRGYAPVAQRTRGSKLATWLAWITSLVVLIILGLSMIPFSDADEIAYGVPPLLNALLWCTPLVVVLVAAVAVCTIAAWAKRYWRFSARLHYTSVLVAGVAFIWFLSHWNLLGFGA